MSASTWEEVAQRAAEHGVAPLLFQRLQALSSTVRVPASAMNTLRDLYADSMLRGMQIHRSLHQLLSMFRRGGIPIIVLKGAHLAQLIYKNVALRPMIDVDILVRKANLPRVHEMLLAMGYNVSGSQAQLEKEHFHYIYSPPDDGIGVEVHWNIQQPTFQIDVDGLWERALPASIAGVEVLVLSREDLLLHLCLHVSSHHLYSWFGLRAICDISETIHHYGDQIDWHVIQERSREWKASNSVYLTLLLARKLLDTAVPDSVLRGIKPDDFDARLVAWAEGRIFAGSDAREEPPSTVSDGFGRLWASRRFLDKISIFLKLCFPASTTLLRKYNLPPHSRRVYLYYPLHVGDFILRHGRTVWLMLRRDGETIEWADREAGRVSLVKWLTPAR
ncbi:MAG: nucleotidyltransferase family protein [Anaerolineae bacterium]|nr:nucleotidyltransferase family protein [Anaerolineae bacterium]